MSIDAVGKVIAESGEGPLQLWLTWPPLANPRLSTLCVQLLLQSQ